MQYRNAARSCNSTEPEVIVVERGHAFSARSKRMYGVCCSQHTRLLVVCDREAGDQGRAHLGKHSLASAWGAIQEHTLHLLEQATPVKLWLLQGKDHPVYLRNMPHSQSVSMQ